MEYMQEFAVVQGVLLSLQRTNGQLKTITSQNPDFEGKVETILECMTNCLEKLGRSDIPTENEDTLRKIGLYLILNTDLDIRDDLSADVSCGHLVDSAPTLSKDLLIKIMCNTPLEKFMLESILLSPPALSIELLDVLTEHSKNIPQNELYPFIVNILLWVYKKLHSFKALKADVHKCDVDCVAWKYALHFISLSASFKGNEQKNIKEVDAIRELGIKVKWSVILITWCVQYNINPEEPSDKIKDTYRMSVTYDYRQWHQDVDSKPCEKLLEYMWTNLMEIVVCISVDTWLQWSELLSDSNRHSSLQKDIGESVYRCLEVMKEAEKQGTLCNVNKDLLTMLTSFVIKPRDEDDEIEEADITLILKRIPDESSSQKKWLKALLKKFDDVISREECVECILNNLTLIDLETASLLLDRVVTFLQGENESIELTSTLKELSLNCIKNLCFSEQLILLNEFLLKYGVNSYLCTKNYDSTAVKVFNSTIDAVQEMQQQCYSDILILSFQRPEDVIQRLVSHAVISDSHAQIMTDIIEVIKPLQALMVNTATFGDEISLIFCTIYNIMQKPGEMEFTDSAFISFVVKLVTNGILSREQFLKKCLLSLLHRSLADENWKDVILYLQILKVFLDGTVNSTSTLKPVLLLLLLAEVLQRSRKNLYSFSNMALQACETAIHLINILLNSFNINSHEDPSLQWLRQELASSVSPLNLLYFLELCSKFNGTLPFVTIDWKLFMLHKMRFEECDLKSLDVNDILTCQNEIIGNLIQLLPVCTTQEWVIITKNIQDSVSPQLCETSSLFVFDILISSLRVITSIVTSFNTEKGHDRSVMCLDTCLRNFAVTVKEIYLGNQNHLSAIAAASVLQKFVHLCLQLPAVVQESCAGVILNIKMALISHAFEDLETILSEAGEQEKETVQNKCDAIVRGIAISVVMIENKGTRQALARKLRDRLVDVPCNFA